MPSLGDTLVMAPRACASGTVPASSDARDLVSDARGRERAGCISEAIAFYESAIAQAEAQGDDAVLAEALRRLAVVRHRRNESSRALELCNRSYEVARRAGNGLRAAEALNTLGGFALTTGALGHARASFLEALVLGDGNGEVCARVEQNLGILANIQGELAEAFDRYSRSLEAYRSAADQQGCAVAYHNLGMVSADLQLYDEADRYFTESYRLAACGGDVHLQGLCLVNHAEVHVARQRFEAARSNAEEALALFDRLGARAAKAEAYRVIGVVYRETGRPALAEARLRSAIELAVEAGSVLNEAEASRELACLYQTLGRNQDALALLNVAYRLFRRLDARVDVVCVAGKMAQLEGTYLSLVRAWGQSIESSDSYTFGHSERVARHAVAVARALGLDDLAQTTIRLGAYLHDVGKVRVPHELLSKPGPLTPAENAVVQLHPLWGIELLAETEFPWDIKPIVRCHHERYDGSGYPDGLRGEDIPLAAQIVGIADVYDALTTTRAYQPALSVDAALVEITRCRSWWSDRVLAAFLRVMPSLAGAERSPETAVGRRSAFV
jgi:putative nucleotidyltransferase with HDIG domain